MFSEKIPKTEAVWFMIASVSLSVFMRLLKFAHVVYIYIIKQDLM